jgi:hypothetical protein
MPSAEIDKILSKIGKNVEFTYPGDEGKKRGILRDRAVFEGSFVGEVPYWDVVDLIEFESEVELEFIRISYYRKKPGQSLNFGGQTSITEPLSVWKKILVSTAREKKWFRTLLQDVMSELENP